MKLTCIRVENILGCPDGTYEFKNDGGHPLDVVVVTGATASGKTSLLEAICAAKDCVGGYGPAPNPARLLRRGASRGRLGTEWVLGEDERRLVGAPSAHCSVDVLIGSDTLQVVQATADLRRLFEHFPQSKGLGKFEYFPANRELHPLDAPALAPPLPVGLEAPVRLTKASDKYAPVYSTLVGAAMSTATGVMTELREKGVVLGSPSNDRLDPYRAALKQLTDGVRIDGVAFQHAQPRLRFAHRGGYQLDLEDLSAWERQAVLFATTFVRLGLNDSVVLLDEPELHVHPADQLETLRRIANLGTNNQLFVATTSASILRAMRAPQVTVLGAAS